MDKRKITGILIIVTGAIVLIAIIYFMFFYGTVTEIAPAEKEAASQPTLPASTTQQPDKPKAVFEVKQPSEVEITQADLKQLAASFTERFGSYSNQSDYGNIRDLKIFMSLKMQAWADDFVSKSRAEKGETGIYSGITTKAIAQEVKELDETAGQAEILIKTRRRQATGTTSDATAHYQDIVIKFVREKGEWKVDSAEWQ